MIDFLRLLIQRCRSEIGTAESVSAADTQITGRSVSVLRQSLLSLVIAESALSKISLCQEFPEHLKQVVVIGPTQVGKSSMVNLLLNQELADASHVAGFTVHCQGYAIGEQSDNDSWATYYFSDLEPRAQSSLDRQVLNEYSLTSPGNPQGSGKRFDGTVFWDTPDFDSVDSFGYRVPVLKALALADLIVFVVSKDKYADKTVWDMLARLKELSKPVLLVMNKTPVEYRSELAASVQGKYDRLKVEGFSAAPPELFFIDEYKNGPAGAADTPELESIRVAIEAQLRRSDVATLESQVNQFMSVHWSEWTATMVDEHRLQMEWKGLVNEVAEMLVDRYRSEYLETTRYKETFQLALAELLALLEVPGMAEPLSKIRSVVTWPMRKLIERATETTTSAQTIKDDRSEERRLLEELGEHGLSRLTLRVASQHSDQQWWAALQDRLDSDKTRLLDGYHNGLDNYQTLLQVEIERAAQSLYKNLEKQPATLNSLRAARVTADAAAVVLAVKSGGLGAVDLVIAPAMLSLTSMLTEGALGQYMQTVQQELRVYQEKEVAAMIGRKLRVRLYPLAGDSGSVGRISPVQLQQATQALGLDLPKATKSLVTAQRDENGVSDV